MSDDCCRRRPTGRSRPPGPGNIDRPRRCQLQLVGAAADDGIGSGQVGGREFEDVVAGAAGNPISRGSTDKEQTVGAASAEASTVLAVPGPLPPKTMSAVPTGRPLKSAAVVGAAVAEPDDREARSMTAIGDKKTNRWHLQIAERWIVQYNFHVNDPSWGRMFVRMCPYLPFSARVCLNQHHWLANRMREEGIDFEQCSNAFLRCGAPERLRALADTLSDEDLASCGRKRLVERRRAARLPPAAARKSPEYGCRHIAPQRHLRHYCRRSVPRANFILFK
jgi:hypothetical protein